MNHFKGFHGTCQTCATRIDLFLCNKFMLRYEGPKLDVLLFNFCWTQRISRVISSTWPGGRRQFLPRRPLELPGPLPLWQRMRRVLSQMDAAGFLEFQFANSVDKKVWGELSVQFILKILNMHVCKLACRAWTCCMNLSSSMSDACT